MRWPLKSIPTQTILGFCVPTWEKWDGRPVAAEWVVVRHETNWEPPKLFPNWKYLHTLIHVLFLQFMSHVLTSGALWGTKSIVFMISSTRLLPASLRFCVTFSHFLLIEANSPIPVFTSQWEPFHPSWGCSPCRRYWKSMEGARQNKTCCTNIPFSFLSDFLVRAAAHQISPAVPQHGCALIAQHKLSHRAAFKVWLLFYYLQANPPM